MKKYIKTIKPGDLSGNCYLIKTTNGFILIITAKTKKHRHIAMTLFTFGLLFLGMDMMSSSLKPLRTYEPFIELMKNVETPILGIIMGLVFIVRVESAPG